MKNFKTTITALITPFINQNIDFESLHKLINNQLAFNIGGFVINGTTGESPTLEWTEVVEIYHFVKKLVPQELPLIIGTGSNSTKKTIELSKRAEELGADALLIVVPYYNKPSQKGLIAHFNVVADSIETPLILYNVPSRTITSLSLPTIIELSKHKNIIGIKEASGNISFAKEIIESCGSEFLMLSGDDGSYPEFIKTGGHGIISVASHIIPDIFVNLLKNQGDSQDFKKYHRLINLLFTEANPIPIKKALQFLNIIKSAELRLPLTILEENITRDLLLELENVGIL